MASVVASELTVELVQCHGARVGPRRSQAELSHQSGVAPATIPAFENGPRRPCPRSIRDRAPFLGPVHIRFVDGYSCVSANGE